MFKNQIEVTKASKWYSRNCSPLDPNKPFIFFAASSEPERTVIPDAGFYHDYGIILQLLDEVVPKNWQIIYKEHPRSFSKPVAADNPRDVDFFVRLLSECPRVKFLDSKIVSADLIKYSKAVVVLGGTAGFEAITRGKHVLMFGQCWYGRCNGVFTIKTKDDLKRAIKTIRHQKNVKQTGVIEYLSKLELVGDDYSHYYKDLILKRSKSNKLENIANDDLITKSTHEVVDKFLKSVKQIL